MMLHVCRKDEDGGWKEEVDGWGKSLVAVLNKCQAVVHWQTAPEHEGFQVIIWHTATLFQPGSFISAW